jgi:hypothetical protein
VRLQHDPKTKQQIKDVLYDLLYRPVQAAYRKRLKAIILKNCELQHASHPSLTYLGEVYVAEHGITPPPGQLTELNDQLKPEMDDYLKETAYLNRHELPHVLGYIDEVLKSSDSLPDYLRLLPDSVHQPIRQLVASCPCRTMQLATEEIDHLRRRNTSPIEIMRQRLARNLLL